MLLDYVLGQASIILRVKIRDSSVTTGAGLTGLTSASSGLIISTIADNEASATAYSVASSKVETISTLGTFAAPTATKCRFKEVDSTNHPGIYEIQIADARFAVSSAKSLLVSLSGAANMVQTDALVPLRSVNPYDGAAFGLSRLSGDAFARIGAAGAGLTAIPVVAHVTLVDTVTTLTGHTAQTGDSFPFADRTVGRGTVGAATTPSTTQFTLSALTPAGVAADQFKGRIIIFDRTTATTSLRGQATDITASSAAALPLLTFTALTTAPASGDTFSIL